MAKKPISDERLAELQKKHNLPSEVNLAAVVEDLAEALEVEGSDSGSNGDDEGDGTKGGPIFNMAEAMKKGSLDMKDIMPYQMMLEMMDLQEQKREAREDARERRRIREEEQREQRVERKQAKPEWVVSLETRLTTLESKITTSPSAPAPDPAIKGLETRLDDMSKKNDTLLEQLNKERADAKDEKQRQYIDTQIANVRKDSEEIKSLIKEITSGTKTKGDFFDQYDEVKRKASSLGLELNIKRPGDYESATSREQVAIDAAEGVVKEGKEVIRDARLLVKEVADDVILPRMRVESGVSKTGLLTDKDKASYYERLGIK